MIISIAKNLARAFLSQKVFIDFWAWWVARKIEDSNDCIPKADCKIRLLVLNGHRFHADLEALRARPSVDLVELPYRVQFRLNSLTKIPGRGTDHFDEKKFGVHEARRFRREFLGNVLSQVCKKRGVDGLITCSFYYVQDIEWDRACHDQGILFISLAKESVRSWKMRQRDYEIYSKRPFSGHLLCVYGEDARQNLISATVCDEQKIHVIGVPRMDDAYVASLKRRPPKKQITLFSFAHRVAQQNTGNMVGGFSPTGTEGVVGLFRQTHGAFAEVALEHSDFNFIIKTKYNAPDWCQQIRRAIHSESGLDPDSIPNLQIVQEVGGTELILQSKVIIGGYNSTTILEGLLIGRPTIILHFAELTDKYSDITCFEDLWDSLLVARSKESLKSLIREALAGKQTSGVAKQHTLNMRAIRGHLGFWDGRSSDRLIDLAIKEMNKIRQEQRKYSV